MIIKECHPAWLEDDDLKCPACGVHLEDSTEYEHPYDDSSVVECPKCKVALRFSRTVRVNYDLSLTS